MLLLMLSLAVLALGPVCVPLFSRRPGAAQFLDGFVVVAIGGLALFHILPHSIAIAGWFGLLAAAAGWAAQWVLEPMGALDGRGTASRAAGTGGATDGAGGGTDTSLLLLLAVLAVGVHGFIDGMSLADVGHGDGSHAHAAERTHAMLGAAVFLHRLPLAIGLWWLARPLWGAARSAAMLVAIGVATAVGFGAGSAVLQVVSPVTLAAFQALVAVSLLHVAAHAPFATSDNNEAQRAWPSALGGLLGVASLLAMAWLHPITDASATPVPALAGFLSLTVTLAPWVLAAYGLIALTRWLQPGGAGLVAGATPGGDPRGWFHGLWRALSDPVCSCGDVPHYRRFIRRTLPGGGDARGTETAGTEASTLAYLVAAPELGFGAVLVSLPLLGHGLTMARVVGGMLLALGVGWVLRGGTRRVGRGEPGGGHDHHHGHHGHHHDHGRGLAGLGRALHFAFVQQVDHRGPWLLLGLGLAGWLYPLLDFGWFHQLPGGLDVPLLAMVGMPLYACAAAFTPIAAVFLANGVSAGAVLTFLLSAPSCNVRTVHLLVRVHGRRTATLFVTTMTLLVILLGYGTNALGVAGTGVQGLFNLTVPWWDAPAWRLACGGVLLGLVLASLLRQGVRAFISQILQAS